MIWFLDAALWIIAGVAGVIAVAAILSLLLDLRERAGR